MDGFINVKMWHRLKCISSCSNCVNIGDFCSTLIASTTPVKPMDECALCGETNTHTHSYLVPLSRGTHLDSCWQGFRSGTQWLITSSHSSPEAKEKQKSCNTAWTILNTHDVQGWPISLSGDSSVVQQEVTKLLVEGTGDSIKSAPLTSSDHTVCITWIWKAGIKSTDV